jgi:hypothetical protein
MEYWGEYYGFSTKRLSALRTDPVVSLYRVNKPIEQMPSAPGLVVSFGGNYYYLRQPQQNPYYDTDNAKMFDDDAQMLIDMVSTIKEK